jgi:hypothetical protein
LYLKGIATGNMSEALQKAPNSPTRFPEKPSHPSGRFRTHLMETL